MELQFWRGITFAEQGRESEARAVLVEVYRRDQNWAELLRRLPMIEPALAGAEVIARLSALTATIIGEIRFHDLRHTHATMLLRRGVHPKVVQERLGHANMGITLASGHADRGDLLLRESQRFRGYFGQGLIGAGVTSTFKGVIEIDQAMIGLIGHTREELARRSRADLTHPDDVAADVAQFDRVMAGKIDGYRLEKRFIHKGGRAVDVDVSARAGVARQRPIDRPPMSIEAARGHNHGRMGANRGGP